MEKEGVIDFHRYCGISIGSRTFLEFGPEPMKERHDGCKYSVQVYLKRKKNLDTVN